MVTQSTRRQIMTRLYPVVIALSIVSIIVSCASRQRIEKAPPAKLVEIILAKDINDTGMVGLPVNSTNTFDTEDNRVVALVVLENFSGKHDIRWEWVDPTGDPYVVTDNFPLTVQKGKYLPQVTAWHQISLKNEPAAEIPGKWSVRIFVDDELIQWKQFYVSIFNPLKLPEDISLRYFPEDWALIIGIEDYDRLPSVPYARKDARFVHDYFNRILGVPQENIITLIDHDATKARIQNYLKQYISSNVGNDTRLYIYFAGHGMPVGKKGEPYLVPFDADIRFIEETGYKLNAFFHDLEQLSTKRVFVFFDTCFNGMASRSEEMLITYNQQVPVKFESVKPLTNSIIFFSGTSPGETNHAFDRLEHGLFTFYLLWGLNGKADTDGDGWTSVDEIYGFVYRNVKEESRRTQSKQTPTIVPPAGKMKDVTLSGSVR